MCALSAGIYGRQVLVRFGLGVGGVNNLLPPSTQGHGSGKWPLHTALSPGSGYRFPLMSLGFGVITDPLCQGRWVPSTLPTLCKQKTPFR